MMKYYTASFICGGLASLPQNAIIGVGAAMLLLASIASLIKFFDEVKK